VGADGWLLQGAQQGVLPVLVELVCAIDDGDLPARHERLEREPSRELANLLDADVATILLAYDHTDVGMRAGRDPRALRACTTRVPPRRSRRGGGPRARRPGPASPRPPDRGRERHSGRDPRRPRGAAARPPAHAPRRRAVSPTLREPALHLGDHAFTDPLDRLCRIDHAEAGGLGCREGAKSLTHALVEGNLLALEAVLGFAAPTDAGEPLRHRTVEEKGECRRDAAPGAGVEGAYRFQIDTAPVPLVGDRRFREAI